MSKLFIVDASGFLYRAYHAITNMTNSKGESTNALFGFIRSLLKLHKDFAPTHIVAVFDGPENTKKRKAIYPEYKANRSSMPEDLRYQIGWAREFCELHGIPLLNIPEVEADDAMGSVAKWAEEHFDEIFLCTGDKDMAQLVGNKIKLLNTHKENLILDAEGVLANYGVPPDKIIDLFAIMGDSSDNIPGLSGFGPKTAVALLQQFAGLEELLANPTLVPGKKKQEILIEQAEKARISKVLVTIDIQVEFPKERNFFEKKSPQAERMHAFCSSMNFMTFLKEMNLIQTPVSEEKNSYTVVDDESALEGLIRELSQQTEICFDTETTDINPMAAELVGIGFCTEPKKAYYVPLNGRLGSKYVLEKIKPLFSNSKIGFYGHNVKYDLAVLNNHGIPIARICFDTILASFILHSEKRRHSLDDLCVEYFDKIKIPIETLIGKGKNQITMKDVPIALVGEYCCEDADYTCRLKEILQKQLKERKLDKVYRELELPLVPVLTRMEKRGMYMDREYMETLQELVDTRLKDVSEEIFLLAGTEFNLNSPKQLSEILFTKMGINPPKKTATGFSTDVEVLELLQHDYEIAKKLIDYRTLEKLRSTYIQVLPTLINKKTGRIHCTFNQFVAATGRLSCRDPNLQNIPIRNEEGKNIRKAFRPEKPGWCYLAADYSQIELRLLAHFSGDPVLTEAFKSGEDIHVKTAATIFNISPDKVTEEMRYRAKAVNFGVIYGQQAFGLAKELGIDFNEAKKFIEKYFETFPSVKKYLEECKEKARQEGKAVTFTGRERAIPEIHSKNQQIRSAAERLAVNTPLQGSAADLIKKAMLQIDSLLLKENYLGYMILQIHDELIFELPDFEEPIIRTIVKANMENAISLNVPLIVNISVGKNWKEC